MVFHTTTGRSYLIKYPSTIKTAALVLSMKLCLIPVLTCFVQIVSVVFLKRVIDDNMVEFCYICMVIL